MIHELKILPEYFDAVCSREKTFELRKNDRGYKVGDYLHLKEWDGEKYTGREVTRYVNYILCLRHDEVMTMTISDGTWLVIFGFCIGILVGAFIGRLK